MARTLSCLLLIAALVALMALAACGGARHSADERYVLVATNVKVSYWQQSFAGLTRAAAEMKVKAEMVGPESYDPAAERDELRRAVQRKATGILISVGDAKVLGPEIDNAIAQGIPVVTIDSDAPASKRLTFIGTDNYRAGVTGAQVVMRQLHGKGSVAVYTIEGQENLAERLHGYRETFAAQPGVKIAEVVDMKGDPRVAFDRTRELLAKSPQPDAYVCLEAIACPEVADVLQRSNVTGKVVVAMDTDQRTLEAVQKGLITATIGQKPFTMAYLAVKLLDDLHHHPPAPLDKNWSQDSFSPLATFIDTGATLIDKSNVEQFISERNSAAAK
jgi:ribose transport system substrate-binding protein